MEMLPLGRRRHDSGFDEAYERGMRLLNADKPSPASSARSTKRRVRGGCFCQWELKAPTDRSRSDCVHEQVAKRIANVRFTLKLSKLDVNMFSAVNNSLINNGCGLYRGRLILPYEHLSRFQNDLID